MNLQGTIDQVSFMNSLSHFLYLPSSGKIERSILISLLNIGRNAVKSLISQYLCKQIRAFTIGAGAGEIRGKKCGLTNPVAGNQRMNQENRTHRKNRMELAMDLACQAEYKLSRYMTNSETI